MIFFKLNCLLYLIIIMLLFFFFIWNIYIYIYWNLKKYLVIFLLCWIYFIIRIIIWVSWAFHSFTQNICKLKFIEIHKFFFPFLNWSYIFELDLVIYIYFEFWIYVYYFIFFFFTFFNNVRNGIKSYNSVSVASLKKFFMWIAFDGFSINELAEFFWIKKKKK